MKKAVIVYHSKTGTTKKLSEEIADFCALKKIQPVVTSIHECTPETFRDAEYIFLGCWTHGLMILFQHPDSEWTKFAQTLPDLSDRRIILFTTYKLATGSMFRKMRRYITCKYLDVVMELKSRDGSLPKTQQAALDALLAA